MDMKPESFFIGVIDFFSVILPGAVLTYLVQSKAKQVLFDCVFPKPASEAAGWAVFLFASYLLGHFVFLLGAKLDDWVYDPIRKAADPNLSERDIRDFPALAARFRDPTNEVSKYLMSRFCPETRQMLESYAPGTPVPALLVDALLTELKNIVSGEWLHKEGVFGSVKLSAKTKRLVGRKLEGIDLAWFNRLLLHDAYPQEIDKQDPPYKCTKRLASWLFPKDANLAVDQLVKMKKRYLPEINGKPAINAFQWAKARLTIQCPSALSEVHRFEADSKFFRSLLVVLVFLVLWLLVRAVRGETHWLLVLGILVLIWGAFWRYIERRFKATQSAYWYVITLEHCPATAKSESKH